MTNPVNVLFFGYRILSALIRHNRPGIAAFRLANGYAALRDALSSESQRFQRYMFSFSLVMNFMTTVQSFDLVTLWKPPAPTSLFMTRVGHLHDPTHRRHLSDMPGGITFF